MAKIMAKSILGCLLSSSCHSQVSSSKDLDAFYHSYSEDLIQLSKSLSHGSVSLKWPVEAMKILKNMQAELLVLIKKSNMPLSFGSSEDADWFHQYMKDTITILDSCNSLKLAVSRVHRYGMIVGIMVNKLIKREGSSKAVEYENQNYLNFSNLKETVEPYGGMSSEDKSHSSVMVAVSVLLHSAIVSPVSIKSGGCDSAGRCPRLKPFIEMLSTLARELSERDPTVKNGENSAGLELVEHEVVVRVMVDVQAQVMDGIEDKERFFSSLELLRISSVELKEGIEKLNAAVDDVFDVVIKGRNEMLGVLRDSDLSIK